MILPIALLLAQAVDLGKTTTIHVPYNVPVVSKDTKIVTLTNENKALQEDNKRLQLLLDKLIQVKCFPAITEINKTLDRKQAAESPKVPSKGK